jgi:hypothetical protein
MLIAVGDDSVSDFRKSVTQRHRLPQQSGLAMDVLNQVVRRGEAGVVGRLADVIPKGHAAQLLFQPRRDGIVRRGSFGIRMLIQQPLCPSR